MNTTQNNDTNFTTVKRLRRIRPQLALGLALSLTAVFCLFTFRAQASRATAPAANAKAGETAQYFADKTKPAQDAPKVLGTCDTAGPIEVEATAGTLGPTAYPTLSDVFTAINAGTHQGAINVEVCGNTTETASAILNSGAVAPAAYTSVNVAPVGGARTITGSFLGAIIKLNGADNVTLDGRIGGVGTARSLSVTNTNATSGTAAVWLASVAAGNGASNNIVRNLELATGIDTSASGSLTYGIMMNGTTLGVSVNGIDNDNNSFIANRIIKARYGIVTRGTTTDLSIGTIVTDNIIGPAAFGTDQISKVGIFMQADTGALVSRNTVQFVGCLDPQACAGADRMGIAIGNESWSTGPGTITSNTYTVTRNVIHDVIEENTFSAVGINLATTGGGSATNNLVANNFIYNVRANAISTDQTVGLGIAGGHTDTVVNNSISLTGDVDPGVATASASNGSGIRIGQANGTSFANLTLQNNSVYMDLSSSSTAANRYYAISGPINTYTFGTGGENFNNYYINPANTQLQTGGLGTAAGNTLTTQFATLALWQAAYTAPQDAASIQADPLHASPTVDLHLTGGSPNINVGATIAAVTLDIDNEARPNGAAYDIGADEFYPSPGALQLSSLTYGGSEGGTVAATVNRVAGSAGTVGVTYTLANGTGIGGAACGVGIDYVNPGPQLLSFGDLVTSQPISVTLCTDAVIDLNETFTITLSLPTGGATLGSPTVATATITDIPPPFNGTYSVGTGGTYPSLTNTGGMFEAVNISGATGPVTINIISDLTGETGLNPLNPLAGSPAVLIKPSGAPRTISGIAPIAVIRLNGADNVRIEGSTAATLTEVVGGTPALRELTVQNLSTSSSSGVIALHTNTDGAQNNTIRNVNVDGNSPTTTLNGISIGGGAVGVTGADNDGNRIENCRVRRAIFGIYSAGINFANQNTGTVITMNDLSATTTDRVARVGIQIFNDNGIQITENSIGGLLYDVGTDVVGIGLGAGTADGQISATATTAGGVTNALVARNKINGVNSSSTLGFSAIGIAVAGDAGGANTIVNNMITGVTAPATSPDFPAGIFVAGVAGSSTRVYNNSVALTGDRSFTGASASQMPGYGIAITGVDPTVELKNNIFYTTQIASAGGAGAESYAIGMFSTTFANLDSNYNLFFSGDPLTPGNGFRTGSLTIAAGTDSETLAAWRTATGGTATDDFNSLETDPFFINPLTDLHLQNTPPAPNPEGGANSPTAISPAIDVGTPLASVTDDFDGNGRGPGSFFDIGGDEAGANGPTASGVSLSGRVLTSDGRPIRFARLTLNSFSNSETLETQSDEFGNFIFDEMVEPGATYSLTVAHPRYQFGGATRVVSVSGDLEGIIFVADKRTTRTSAPEKQ